MKVMMILVSVLLVGCGAAGPGGGAAEVEEAQAADDTAVSDAPGVVAGSDEKTPQGEVVGSWENASCGERQYIRRIAFDKAGTFVAVDEVAPCPPNEQERCVSSGIIEWRGSWILTDNTITLEAEPVEGGKMPELVPDGFVVLSRNPFSLGESIGELVCPYQRAK